MSFWQKLLGRSPTVETAPEEKELTAYFASIDSYVGLAEQTELTLLNRLMQDYFSICSEAIEANGGVLDKFIGDGVVACFGLMEPMPDQAFRACAAALHFQRSMAGLRRKLAQAANEWPVAAREIGGRVGIHTGQALGSARPGTGPLMMGDNINLAARLEKGAKHYAAQIICTEQTRQRCEESRPDQILFRPLGRIVVKGRMEPVQLHEPVALRSEATKQMHDCVAAFTEGLAGFRARDLDRAAECFRASAALESESPGGARNPSVVFLEMVHRAREIPPAFLP